MNEVAPQPGCAVMDRRAVHREHIRMTHSSQPPSLIEMEVAFVAAKQLEGNLHVQRRISRHVHVAEATSPKRPHDLQVAPRKERRTVFVRVGDRDAYTDARLAERIAEPLDGSQMFDDTTRRTRVRGGVFPVNAAAVGERGGNVQ